MNTKWALSFLTVLVVGSMACVITMHDGGVPSSCQSMILLLTKTRQRDKSTHHARCMLGQHQDKVEC